MTERNVLHSTFVIDRVYDAPAAAVFAAWASRETKGKWFVGPADWERPDHKLDFREGGREREGGNG